MNRFVYGLGLGAVLAVAAVIAGAQVIGKSVSEACNTIGWPS